MTHYDLIVIGSGPAGQKAAVQAAKLGKRVAIIDRMESMGGVCLHTGTIPSKTLKEAVLYLSGWSQRGLYGDDYRLKSDLTMQDLQLRLKKTIEREVEVINHQLHRNGIETVQGVASFIDPHLVRVEQATGKSLQLKGDSMVIATGTHPYRPESIPFDGERVLDSDDILQLQQRPRSLTVVGAGVIGVEYAAIFSAMDVEVTLLDGRQELLGFLDREITDEFIHSLRQRGVSVRLGETVATMRVDSAAGQVVTETESGKKIVSEVVLFAAGRSGTTNSLQLDKAGIRVNKRHQIAVNDDYQTEVPHIYAAGDVIGFPSLASTSMEQGRRIACHAFGKPLVGKLENFPFGIYAVPEMSMVGETEQQLMERGVAYDVGIARLRETARGQIMGIEEGMLKMLFSLEDQRLLGVHILGEGATELIHIGQAVLSLGGGIHYFLDSVFNYPTLAEAYKIAALDAWNRISRL
ncbi:Si-specific NAD(P)(+) transhydrogenase [Ectothiorhodospiraceae bacterium BW-2]|nr:Si-specific NAD(P)(+) transhydrogenase [Ectothiorhodospiraceae bacterium BW-2]